MAITLGIPSGDRVTIRKDCALVGSDPGCDVCLTKIEPRHARIRRVAARWLVETLGDWTLQVGGGELTRLAWLTPGDVISMAPDGPWITFEPNPVAPAVDTTVHPQKEQLELSLLRGTEECLSKKITEGESTKHQTQVTSTSKLETDPSQRVRRTEDNSSGSRARQLTTRARVISGRVITCLLVITKALNHLVVSMVRKIRVTHVTLSASNLVLGRDIFESGRFRTVFPGIYAEIEKVQAEIARLTKGEAAGGTFAMRAMKRAFRNKDIVQAKALESKLECLLRRLGEAVFSLDGVTSGEQGLKNANVGAVSEVGLEQDQLGSQLSVVQKARVSLRVILCGSTIIMGALLVLVAIIRSQGYATRDVHVVTDKASALQLSKGANAIRSEIKSVDRSRDLSKDGGQKLSGVKVGRLSDGITVSVFLEKLANLVNSERDCYGQYPTGMNYHRGEFLKVFGSPDSDVAAGYKRAWLYQCSDGVVILTAVDARERVIVHDVSYGDRINLKVSRLKVAEIEEALLSKLPQEVRNSRLSVPTKMRLRPYDGDWFFDCLGYPNGNSGMGKLGKRQYTYRCYDGVLVFDVQETYKQVTPSRLEVRSIKIESFSRLNSEKDEAKRAKSRPSAGSVAQKSAAGAKGLETQSKRAAGIGNEITDNTSADRIGTRQVAQSDLPESQNGRWGFVDDRGRVIWNKTFEEAAGFSEGLAAVKNKGMWGFIDRSGKLRIDYQFEGSSRFIGGKAQVWTSNESFEIDSKGNRVQSEDGRPQLFEIGGKWGFKNNEGRIIIKPQYDLASQFHDGIAVVNVGDTSGIIDVNGAYVLPLQSKKWIRTFWRDAKEIGFSERLLAYRDEKEMGEGYVDKRGNVVIPARFFEAQPFSEGLACVVPWEGMSVIERKFQNNELSGVARFGFINTSGNWVIQPQFDDGRDFSDGLAPVKVGAKWGFIDRTGRLAIEPRFDEVPFGFHHGIARFKENHRIGFIDKTGKVILKPIFLEASDFDGGIAAVRF